MLTGQKARPGDPDYPEEGCDSCHSMIAEIECHPRQDHDGRGSTMRLCHLCAGTMAGNAYDCERAFASGIPDVLQAIAYVGNEILTTKHEAAEILRAALKTAVECGDTQRKRIRELEEVADAAGHYLGVIDRIGGEAVPERAILRMKLAALEETPDDEAPTPEPLERDDPGTPEESPASP